MKIGINLIALYDEKSDGSFRYIHMLLKEMANYTLQNVSFVIYKQKQISSEFLNLPANLDVKYVDVPAIGRGIKRIVFEQTLFYLYMQKTDVMYSYCLSLPLLFSGVKIFTLHDLYSYIDTERYSFFRKLYIRGMIRLYAKTADKILTVSENSKKDIIKYLSVPKKKIILTYNFVKPLTVDNNIEIITSNGDMVDTTAPFFLYVGSLHNGKNIERMCKAFNKYVDNGGSKRLLIVGKVMENEEAYIDIIRNSSKISYLGYLPRTSVDFLFKSCYAVVLVSLYEGFGIPPLEGFLFSKPAIVSSSGSLPEVVGEAGVYTDPLNVEEITNSFFEVEKKYDYFVSKTKDQVLKFSPQKSVEEFMKALGITYHKNNENYDLE